MWYLLAGIASSILIILNKKGREVSLLKYIVISILIPPLGFGLWHAEKPLLPGELRDGGKGWIIMKNFAIFHTILCILWAFFALGLAADVSNSSANDYEKAGAAIGAGTGIFLIAGIWFGGTLGSLILGLILKKPIIEK